MPTVQKQFPVQKTGAPVNEPRRDRGANNKRLTRSESAPVAFTAPIAGTQLEAHETSEPTRDGEGVPKVVPCGQLPGSLPKGATLDSLLTREEFCIWQRKALNWFSAHGKRLPGVISHTRKAVRIHPRTYLENSTKGK
jgi:hypothetical protein